MSTRERRDADSVDLVSHLTFDPTIFGATVKAGEVMLYVAWALLREYLVVTGHHERHNIILRSDALQVLSELRQVGRRRAEQILHDGEGRYWHSDSTSRLHLHGHAKIAMELGVTPEFQLHRVPVKDVRDRAAVTATAVHLQLPLGDDLRPITRRRKAELSGVSERQQRRVDESDLVEEVYALYETQLPDGQGSFTGSNGRRIRRIGDVRVPTTHLPTARTRSTSLRRRVRRLLQPLTDKAVAATDGASQRACVFTGKTRREAERGWIRAGKPRGMLAYPSRGRWQRELVEDPATYFR